MSLSFCSINSRFSSWRLLSDCKFSLVWTAFKKKKKDSIPLALHTYVFKRHVRHHKGHGWVERAHQGKTRQHHGTQRNRDRCVQTSEHMLDSLANRRYVIFVFRRLTTHVWICQMSRSAWNACIYLPLLVEAS